MFFEPNQPLAWVTRQERALQRTGNRASYLCDYCDFRGSGSIVIRADNGPTDTCLQSKEGTQSNGCVKNRWFGNVTY